MVRMRALQPAYVADWLLSGDEFCERMSPMGRVRLLAMDRFWAAQPQRLLCGGELGDASVKIRCEAADPLAQPQDGIQLSHR